jgi:hypothetical protein
MERLARARSRPPAEPQRVDQTWQSIPVDADGDPSEAAQAFSPENQYEEVGEDEYSETPTIQLQRIKHNPSGIQSEGTADEMRQAIEKMRAKRRKNRASRQ